MYLSARFGATLFPVTRTVQCYKLAPNNGLRGLVLGSGLPDPLPLGIPGLLRSQSATARSRGGTPEFILKATLIRHGNDGEGVSVEEFAQNLLTSWAHLLGYSNVFHDPSK